MARYSAAATLEDAIDLKERDPAAAHMLASVCIVRMLHHVFRKANVFLPRDKDLIEAIRVIRNSHHGPSRFTKRRISKSVSNWRDASPIELSVFVASMSGPANLRSRTSILAIPESVARRFINAPPQGQGEAVT